MQLMAIHTILTLLMLMVMAWDSAVFRIPNWLNGVLLLIFPLWMLCLTTPPDWLGSLMIFALFLGIGFGLFAVGFLGAGDVKLLAVLGLYTGWSQHSVALIIYMALIGGVLSLVLLVLRRMLHHRGDALPAILRKGQPVPYGVAIAGAFIWLLWFGGLASQGHVV